jgi:hypothetical protein
VRAMDGFFDHIARFGLTEPNVSDFFAFGSLGHGAKGLGNLRAGLAIFDGGDPSLVFVDEAQTQTAAKEQHKGTSSKGSCIMLAVSLSRLLTCQPSGRRCLLR